MLHALSLCDHVTVRISVLAIHFINFEYKIEIKDNDRYVIKPKNVNNVYFW